MKNKIILLIILILVSINITGCWDYVELNQREVITAIGIDKGEEPGTIVVTMQSIIPYRISTPLKPSTSETATHVVSVTGKSFSDALVRYKQITSKNPYFQQSRVFIIGEEAARDGVISFMNPILRSIEYRTRGWLLVAKGKASDILQRQVDVSKISADYILDLMNSSNYMATVPVETAHEFIKDVSVKTLSPVTAKIEAIKSEDNHFDIGYSGSAVFKKDKLIGWLDMHETKGLLWITGKFKRGIMATGYTKTANGILTQKVIKGKAKIIPKITNGKIKIIIDIYEEGLIGENDSNIEMNSTEAINSFENQFEMEIKKQVEACLKRVQQEYKTDVFGFGEEIHKKLPRQWKEIKDSWEEIYPGVNIEVNAKVKLRATGKIIDPIKP
ncbi:Ger(x)C family spore germination protein [Desnuesiella massiliensis]|uniref:Ger(x)C family spore germination protein n=1 Tax=Desnuesiella massiliensis TaxID=1650662 RepID=UPI0006E25826|nr:Ger(x)C family spore germination protein [Desnuesiella massiliensis]